MVKKTKTTEPKEPKQNDGMSIWTLLGDINKGKKNIWEEGCEKIYKPFTINRSLSYHADSILYANEMNQNSGIPEKWNYDYYLNSLRPRSRYSDKKVPVEGLEDIKVIMEYYGYNIHRAKEALKILSKDQLEELRKRCDKGGIR